MTIQIEEQDASAQGDKFVRELYFPTFIYYKDLADSGALNDAIKPHIYARRDADQAGIVRSNVQKVGAWHSQVDMHQREEYWQLSQRIVATVQEIFNDLGYDPTFEPALDNMWANISPKFGYNRHHVHPNALWSAVYYVQAPPEAGRIFFSDPRPQVLLLSPRYDPNKPRGAACWTEVYFQPVEGRMILFPGWLMHEVEPNTSDLEGPAGDRISISFNLFQRRRESE